MKTGSTARFLAVVIAILAILIGTIPQFFNCEYDGKALVLANEREVPMKCYWTARSAIGIAIPLLVVAILMAFNPRAETWRALGILAASLGVIVILLPTVLIGVCQHAGASCSMVMKPALILAGILVISISMLSVVFSVRKTDENP